MKTTQPETNPAPKPLTPNDIILEIPPFKPSKRHRRTDLGSQFGFAAKKASK